MKKWFLFGLFLIIFSSISLALTISPTSTDSGLLNQTINITIDPVKGNATEVKISLPEGLTFVEWTNNTNQTNTQFTYSSSTLIWKNLTIYGFLNSSGWFSFNVNISKNISNRNLSISIEITNTSNDKTQETVYLFVYGTIWSSPKEEFYVKPTYFNFSVFNKSINSTISINSSLSYEIKVYIKNATEESKTKTYGQFTHGKEYKDCYFLYDNAWRYNLFFVESPNYQVYPYVDLSSSNPSSEIILTPNYRCLPGRYIGQIEFANQTENLYINFTVDIPISFENSISENLLNGSVEAKLEANSTTPQIFFINSSLFENSTYFTISSNTSLYISVSNSLMLDNLESNKIIFPSSGEFAKIKIYKNFSFPNNIPYSLHISFSSLNSSKNEINFGNLNLTDSKSQVIEIKNNRNSSTNVTTSIKLWKEYEFSSDQPKSFELLLSPSVKSILAILEWNNSNVSFSLKLFNPSGSLISSSSPIRDFYVLEGRMKEKLNFDINSEGKWVIEVENNSKTLDNYTLKVYTFLDAKDWISLNSSSFSIDRFSSIPLNITLKIPRDSSGGIYFSSILFKQENGAFYILPIKFNVTASSVFINEKFSKTSVYKEDDIGFNRTILFSISILNNGLSSVNISIEKEMGFLNCSSDVSSFLRYNVSYYPNELSSNTSDNINISISIYTNETKDKQCLYSGIIPINLTEQNGISRIFNLSIQYNLTNLLSISSILLNNTIISPPKNISISFVPKYLGNELYDGNETTANISLKLVHLNETSYTLIPQIFYSSVLFDPARSNYTYIFSISNSLGGIYDLYIYFNHTNTLKGIVYQGSSVYHNFKINKEALKANLISPSSLSLYPSNTSYIKIEVWNYGLLKSNSSLDKMKIQEDCAYYSISFNSSNCTYSPSSPSSEIGLEINPNSMCEVVWKIKASDKGDSKYCDTKISFEGLWFNSQPFTIKIKVINTTTPTTPPSTTTQQNQTITISNIIRNITWYQVPSLIVLEQNSTNTTFVTVKNEGNVQEELIFSIKNLPINLYKILNLKLTVNPNQIVSFYVTFNGSGEIGEYSGEFEISTNDSSIKLTKSFKLKIIPGYQTKIYVNKTFNEFLERFVELENKTNELKSKGYKTEIVEQKLSLVLEKLNQLKAYIENNDYYHGYLLLDDINEMLNDINSTFSKLPKEEVKIDWFLIIGVGLTVFGIGFLVYLFWPTESYFDHKKKKFVWKPEKRKEDWFKKIKEEIKKLKPKQTS